MGLLKYKGIYFDEWTKDEYGVWGEICADCQKKHKDTLDSEINSSGGFGACSVQFTKNLKYKEGKSIWIVGGGELLHTFIQEKLVDELIISIAPVLIGRGIPLFKNNDFQTPLSLKSVNRFKQFVELHYEVVRK